VRLVRIPTIRFSTISPRRHTNRVRVFFFFFFCSSYLSPTERWKPTSSAEVNVVNPFFASFSNDKFDKLRFPISIDGTSRREVRRTVREYTHTHKYNIRFDNAPSRPRARVFFFLRLSPPVGPSSRRVRVTFPPYRIIIHGPYRDITNTNSLAVHVKRVNVVNTYTRVTAKSPHGCYRRPPSGHDDRLARPRHTVTTVYTRRVPYANNTDNL